MKKIFIAVLSLLFLSCAPLAFAATANVFPTGPSKVTVGQTFQIVVQVSGAKDADTVRLNGTFTPTLLEWKGAQPAGVFQSVSPGSFSDAQTGLFSFGTFTLGSKANGSQRVAVFTFRAIKAGDAVFQLGSGTRVLSGGEEENGSFGKLAIKIVEGTAAAKPEQPVPVPGTVIQGQTVISLLSSTQPDPNQWYTTSTIQAVWQISGKKVDRVLVGFDQSPAGQTFKQATDSSALFDVPHDGVWYVHLGVVFADKTFEHTDLRVQIDRESPHAIAPIFDQSVVKVSEPNILRFAALDDVSGIDYYEIWSDGNFIAKTTSTSYSLINQSAGRHEVIVKAFDRAGNSAEGRTSYDVILAAAPGVIGLITAQASWISLFLPLILIILLALVTYYFWPKRKKRSS